MVRMALGCKWLNEMDERKKLKLHFNYSTKGNLHSPNHFYTRKAILNVGFLSRDKLEQLQFRSCDVTEWQWICYVAFLKLTLCQWKIAYNANILLYGRKAYLIVHMQLNTGNWFNLFSSFRILNTSSLLTKPLRMNSSTALATPSSSPVQKTYWAISNAEYWPPLCLKRYSAFCWSHTGALWVKKKRNTWVCI